MKKVSELIRGIDCKVIGIDREVDGVEFDTTRWRRKNAFICLRGKKNDGHNFIKELYFKGCEVFFIEDEKRAEKWMSATFIVLKNTREAMGKIARNFWGQKTPIVGITGTKGKSSTAKIISETMTLCGIRCGVIGSVWWKLTTPEAPDTLKIINSSDYEYFAIEVTSIATLQKRINGIEFEAGIFLGLGKDHLDMHGSQENYFKAKLDFLKQVKCAIINTSDIWGKRAEKELKGEGWDSRGKGGNRREIEVITFDTSDSSYDPDKSEFTIKWRGEKIKFKSMFRGGFNLTNFLAAFIFLNKVVGIEKSAINEAFEIVSPPPGRMEAVITSPYVFVDYAHTAESLYEVLKEGRYIAKKNGGKLCVIFGCGGERDKEKRPEMGKVSSEIADIVVITSDNPRGEDPNSIIDDIIKGIKNIHKIKIEPDRKKAIWLAMEQADKNDVIIIAGKGHEEYQITKDGLIPFSDRKVVLEFVKTKTKEWKTKEVKRIG